ncbi:MAG TPA: protein kinase [Burkholderiaceae bacterium]|nr:protein kinase [Burkholderiaceae bacterium]
MSASPQADPEHLKRISALLDVALALPLEQREPWLRTLPPGQQDLVPRLRDLLERAAVESDDFMDRPVHLAGDGSDPSDDATDVAGNLVGPYRLIRELGAGGMATVWLAERSDGTLQRQVALKLPRAGWAHGLARRMVRERDILAALEHPHIARLYDAGVTEAGRPWLAMELVSGQPIDEHCREHHLGVAPRLRLFLQVADAVAHAHARLIVHRDLKPNNILVTADGEVRLLDFGIAKLLEEEVAPDANLTQLLGRAVTPDYASPEQVSGRPVGVATDVYSLGIVLYELLTGQRPYKIGKHSVAALEQAITEADVPLASSTAGLDSGLRRALRGDIDTILAKAVKKDPRERYASVEAFAGDIRRHLAGQPVLARPDALGYRLAKFVQRNRGAVVAVVLVFGAVVAGLVGTLSQATRAERMAEQAERERDTALNELKFAEASEGFMRFILKETSDKPFTTAELLARADALVDRQYASDAALRARMQLVLTDLFAEQRDFTRAQAVLDRARTSAEAAGDATLIAQVDCYQGAQLNAKGQSEAAEPLFARAIARLLAHTPVDKAALVECYEQRSSLQMRMERPQAMIDDASEALRLIGTPRPAQVALVRGLRVMQANAYVALGQTPRAVEIYEQEIAAALRLGSGGATLDTALPNNLAVVLGRSGQVLRALRAYEVGLATTTVDGEPTDHALAINHARLLVEVGRANEAVPRLERGIAASQRAGDPLFVGLGRFGLAAAHCELRDWARCDALMNDARATLQPVLPPDRAIWGTIDVAEARAALARDDLPRAYALLRGAMAKYDAAPDRSPGRSRALALLARVEARQGELPAAQGHASDAVQAARLIAAGFTTSEWIGSALLAQAIVALAQGDSAAATTMLRDALEQLRDSAGDTAPATREAQALLARLR